MNYDYQFNGGSMPQVELNKPAKNGSGMATASLILAIVSLVMVCCCGVSLIPAILAIVFALVARRREGRMPGAAIAGLIIAILCILLTLVYFGLIFYAYRELETNPDGQVAQAIDQAFRDTYGIGFWEYLEKAYQTAQPQR